MCARVRACVPGVLIFAEPSEAFASISAHMTDYYSQNDNSKTTQSQKHTRTCTRGRVGGTFDECAFLSVAAASCCCGFGLWPVRVPDGVSCLQHPRRKFNFRFIQSCKLDLIVDMSAPRKFHIPRRKARQIFDDDFKLVNHCIQECNTVEQKSDVMSALYRHFYGKTST